ncbi:MAG: GNAT family N-acetyltransferase [Rhodothermia bacterium]|nr:GNAT family N-acetyltransferase [Rhodothermia bacterium]
MELQVRPVSGQPEWDAARRIREAVFIDEQSCPPAEEWDSFDETSRHLLGWLGDDPVAVARWRVVPHDERLVAKLERFAVVKHMRGRGFGKRMVLAAIEDAAVAGFSEQYIHAQAHLQSFYEDLGFERVGEAFVEAGIPHVAMLRSAS